MEPESWETTLFDLFGLISLGGIALAALVVLLGLRIGSGGGYD